MANVFDLEASIKLNSDGYQSDLKKAENATDQAANSIGAKSIAIGTAIGNMISAGISMVASYAERAVATGIQYNMQIEQYSTALTTLLGSEAEAAAAIEQIKQDAARTPYSVDGLVKANQLLIAAGVSAGESRETIMALTDAISATGGGNEELTRMAQNLQQVKNVGKATTQDIKQFQMAGIEVYGLIADYTGKSIDEVQELDITYDLLAGALQNAAAEGGKFYGANIAQSQTLAGQVSTLKDAFSQQLGTALSSLTNTLSTSVIPAATNFISSLDMEKVSEGIDKAIGFVANLGDTIINLLPGITAIGTAFAAVAIVQTVQKWTGAITGFFTALSANPIALVVGSLALLGTAIYQACKEADEGKIDINGLSAEIDQLGVSSEMAARMLELADSINSVQQQIQLAESELWNLEAYGLPDDQIAEREAAIESLKNKHSELTAELEQLRAESAAASGATDNLTASIDAGANANAAYADSFDETNAAIDEAQKEIDQLKTKYDETFSKMSKSVSGWFKAFEYADVSVTTSIDEMMAAMQSQIDFNTQYAANLETIRSYDLPELATAFQEMGAEGAAYAEALVSAINDAGGPTKKGGQEIIENFKGLATGVGESRDLLAAELTNLSGEFDDSMSEIVGSLSDRVAEMEMSAEASAAATATMQAYIAAVSAARGDAAAAAASVAAATAAGLNTSVIGVKPSGAPIMTPLAVGSDYIPYDDFPALLHKGEMVVPANISEDLRDFLKSPNEAQAPSIGGLGEVVRLLEAILAKGSDVFVDGKRLSSEMAVNTDAALGDVNMWRGRGLSMA